MQFAFAAAVRVLEPINTHSPDRQYSAPMVSRRAPSLSRRLALASICSAVAVGIVCIVGLVSLRNVSTVAHGAVTRQLALLDESQVFTSLLYQKGFVAHFMLTGDRDLLSQIEARRAAFEAWLASANQTASTPQRRELLQKIQERYAAYDGARRRAVALFEAGHRAEAVRILGETQHHVERLLAVVDAFGELSRAQADRTLADAEDSTEQLAALLVVTSVLGAIASIAAGFFWARRFAKPIYELRLRAESAAQRTRIQVDPRDDDLEGLAEHVTALLRRLEDMDGALTEQRRRLAQHEKLSEIGELAAKLAHELLNPLAGMKAAIQLLARSAASNQVRIEELSETATALDAEITRVERLVRRLVDYARPLTPHFEPCDAARLVDDALEASRRELDRARASARTAVEPGLPPLQADPLLVTQALSNLICNAAQAMTAPGTVDIRVRRAVEHGCDQILFEVADQGTGVAEEHLPRLFRPFFTTKPAGHGLGLAVSQHIALEHGGRITARPRTGTGAVFQVALPVVR
jgi:signal transduction histidine kinase